MARAKFTAVPGLDELVATMVVDEVTDVARQVEREAKALAPPLKEWRSMGDGLVRNQHRRVNGQTRPDNLRFDLTSFDWDVKHPFSFGPMSTRGTGAGGRGGNAHGPGGGGRLVEGSHTYLLAPRDQTAGAYVAIVNCRCVVVLHPNGISKLVKRSATQVRGTKVKAVVYAQGEWVVEAEVGDVFTALDGSSLPAAGTHFMSRAAARVAASRGGSARR